VGPGTLYRSIQRMVVDGFIEELMNNADAAGDERRRTYRLSALGRRVARAEAARLQTLVDAAVARGVIPKRGRPRGE
jgi:DNA-binding PadR family transcriptional regulator